VDGDAAANGDSRRRYAEVAGALVSAMERERSIQLRTAQFVQDLFQAIYVPGCTESAQVLARAAAHVCRCPLRYPAARVVLPALEGFAQQLQLGSLAAAVQAEPALRLMVQHAADALQARVPPVEPVEWSKSGLAQCRYEGCSECAAVRAFLQDAQQSQQHIKMTYLRRRHMEWWVGRGHGHGLGDTGRAETLEVRAVV
jgi:ferredoxin-like protein FixX